MSKSGLILLLIIFMSIILGWFGNNIYRDYSYHRYYNGLWMPSNYSKIQALETAYKYDSVGNWICVNIRGMDIDTMKETVMHEIGHEAFARYCEKDVDKCLEVALDG